MEERIATGSEPDAPAKRVRVETTMTETAAEQDEAETETVENSTTTASTGRSSGSVTWVNRRHEPAASTSAAS